VDLRSRLRDIVRAGPPRPARELTYEPDTGGYEATRDFERLADVLGGRARSTPFGDCFVIDRRYEADRRHGGVLIGECELSTAEGLCVLDPALSDALDPEVGPRTVFIDLETTGLSGGAGTVAFLVGCGYFDLGAFQVRQFLLTSFASERALLAAVAEFLDVADLIVTYNGKTFDVPVMETRWLFHRLEMPLDGVPHFDMLHPARRLWRTRNVDHAMADDGGCRLTTLEHSLLGVSRAGDAQAFEIPSRYFRFLRSGDPRPLEAVLEHNRLDLVSLAGVTACAARLVAGGSDLCRDEAEALALGRVYERAGAMDRAEACYRRASSAPAIELRAEALYRLGLRCRRARRFGEAAAAWRSLLDLTKRRASRRHEMLAALRHFAVEALAIHHEHRDRDLETARELAVFALEAVEPADARRADGMRHRLARLDRKIGGQHSFRWSAALD
jgi:uncharacterized protein YprB with RNaseH-like and TPR domain